MNDARVCFILNYAPHYREEIFQKLIQELPSDIFTGSYVKGNIKKINPDKLGALHSELYSSWFGPFYWINGEVKLLFKKRYKKYILTGQPTCLSDLAFILCCKFTSKEVYFWNHGAYGNESVGRKFFNRLIFSLYDGCFLYSDGAANILMREYKVPVKKINVIYNSLDYSKQLVFRQGLAINGNSSERFIFFKDQSLPTLLFIGRLAKIKRLDLLIDAHNLLLDKGFFCNLLIIGDGEERDVLEGQVRYPDNTFFFGSSYDEQVNAKMIANSDLCVSPGNVGLTAIHSLMYGTPVCTHDNFFEQMPEHEVIEEGKTGLYFSKEKNNLADRIQDWFSLGKNREETRKDCYHVIDAKYNPDYQLKIFKAALK
ncbi:glycosyltransferase family 4 protein [Flavobacterium sp. MFBS3-15]|uniref:glycosyltransferase family 4 protein n=1 Tax=Flavobacterium sp. MFBS3-15 TaxID=2989816 RepID=UPI00223559EF|nr:glycosyltransferase family 4 protein [Flavobacterium sp. MFBS3-15]MCW4469574.1 glycosyltransferase family 4 protein [Flavobacterium sp. MFBS3-15]